MSSSAYTFTPASTWAIMGSRLIVQVLANLIIALVVVILGGRVQHLSLSVGQYGLVLLISILGGAMFLCIGQALVALIKSSETVNSTARLLYIGLILLGLLGQGGSLGHTWDTVARWSPVGTVMTLFAGVLNLSRVERPRRRVAVGRGWVHRCVRRHRHPLVPVGSPMMSRSPKEVTP